jgi:aspartate aminotransferase
MNVDTDLRTDLANVEPSPTITLMDKARRLQQQGANLISLAGGEPDMPPSPAALRAGIERLESGLVAYGPVAGLPELRRDIARDLSARHGLDYNAANVLVGTGSKQVLFEALFAATQPGDEIIIPAPYWVSYPAMASLAGATPRIVQTSAATGFKISPDQLEAALSPRSRWLVINSPSNPTGAVYSRGELQALASVITRHPRLLVIADDIYEDILYDGATHATIAAVDSEMASRCVTCSGFSKGHAMTGLRVGYAAGPEWLIQPMANLQSHLTSGGCVVGQSAAAAALNMAADFPDECTRTYARRRALGLAILQHCKGITVSPPAGAFYLWIGVAGLIGRRSPTGRFLNSDADVAEALLDFGLAVVPGVAFGATPFLRVSFAASDEKVIDGCKHLVGFCDATLK